MENVYVMKHSCLNETQRAKKITHPPSPSLKWRGRKRYFKVKKIALPLVIVFVLFAIVFAQAQRSAGAEKTDVRVRSGKQNGVTRLVFDSEETFIKKTKVSTSGMQIVIEFPSDFNIMPQKGFDLETSIRDRFLTINLKEPFEMKVLRLSSPPRLAVDILASKSKVTTDVKPRPEIALSQKIFVIDAGHGGYDFGIIGNDIKEKEIALSIAKDMEGVLIKKGRTVSLVRKSDQFMSLRDRAIFTNQKLPEIFVSIHVSASGNFALYMPKITDTGSEPSAAELYGLSFRQKKYVQKSRALAENIAKSIKEEFNLNVIQREMSLPILNSVGAPAVLIEVPSFKIISYDQKTRTRLAEAIIRGFSYYGQ